MANPVITPVAAGSWVKVATNVTNVSVHALIHTTVYGWTYRLTTAPAPTLDTESVALARAGQNFCSANAFDLYIKCESSAGSVRIDEDFQAEVLIDA